MASLLVGFVEHPGEVERVKKSLVFLFDKDDECVDFGQLTAFIN